jgi:hypothetical protein
MCAVTSEGDSDIADEGRHDRAGGNHDDDERLSNPGRGDCDDDNSDFDTPEGSEVGDTSAAAAAAAAKRSDAASAQRSSCMT